MYKCIFTSISTVLVEILLVGSFTILQYVTLYFPLDVYNHLIVDVWSIAIGFLRPQILFFFVFCFKKNLVSCNFFGVCVWLIQARWEGFREQFQVDVAREFELIRHKFSAARMWEQQYRLVSTPPSPSSTSSLETRKVVLSWVIKQRIQEGFLLGPNTVFSSIQLRGQHCPSPHNVFQLQG